MDGKLSIDILFAAKFIQISVCILGFRDASVCLSRMTTKLGSPLQIKYYFTAVLSISFKIFFFIYLLVYCVGYSGLPLLEKNLAFSSVKDICSGVRINMQDLFYLEQWTRFSQRSALYFCI